MTTALVVGLEVTAVRCGGYRDLNVVHPRYRVRYRVRFVVEARTGLQLEDVLYCRPSGSATTWNRSSSSTVKV